MLYVKLTKTLYGMLRRAMPFYNNFRRHLEEIGSEINSDDPCEADMIISSFQIIVCWHADKPKVSNK